jgi:hypothetical protein
MNDVTFVGHYLCTMFRKVLWNLILIIMDMLKWMANVVVFFITSGISICRKTIIKWIL